eukprot:765172-Hanusia_phi.AAC.2
MGGTVEGSSCEDGASIEQEGGELGKGLVVHGNIMPLLVLPRRSLGSKELRRINGNLVKGLAPSRSSWPSREGLSCRSS